MYRAILPNGQLECHEYERVDEGVYLYDESGAMLGFVPYENLEALLTERVYSGTEPSVM
jgi:hypothetical protein